MTTLYSRNEWNNTKNNALFYLYSTDEVMFKVDEQTYGCEFYNYEATFKHRKQVESLFGNSVDLISPYDIVELCETMKGTKFEDTENTSEANSGTYNFSNLNIDCDTLRKMMDGEIEYYAA